VGAKFWVRSATALACDYLEKYRSKLLTELAFPREYGKG
jgi:hypothetical protein